jgi:hypothetical protein
VTSLQSSLQLSVSEEENLFETVKASFQSRERYVNVGIFNDKRNNIRAPRGRSLNAWEDSLSRVHWKGLFYELVKLVKSKESQEKQNSFKVSQYSVKTQFAQFACAALLCIVACLSPNQRQQSS